jgi:REP element-mobilizing transposase RayT
VWQAFQPATSARLASLVEEALWFYYAERYVLDAYVVMPDHVHLLMQPCNGWSLAKILQGIKGFTAREINRVLGRKGLFWQNEDFDHLIRSERDWLDKLDYIHMNPVKAGLVDRPHDYPFSSLVTIHSEGWLESLPTSRMHH